MAKITYFVVQSFDVDKRGRASPREPVQAKDAGHARRVGERMAANYGAAIAFSRSGDPGIGEYDDAVILGIYGPVPDHAVEAMAA